MKENAAFRPRIHTVRQAGTMHASMGAPCQDVAYVRERDELCLCALADGQSGRAHCIEGASACMQAVADFLERIGVETLYDFMLREELKLALMQEIRSCLQNLASKYHCEKEEFASTLILFVFNPQTGHYFSAHLGDGCILGLHTDGRRGLISRPDNGITSGYTWLTTSANAVAHLRFSFGCVSHYSRILLATDGLMQSDETGFSLGDMLCSSTPDELAFHLLKHTPRDDASCIWISF